MRSSVSAIIVNWNGLQWLRECLRSLYSQTRTFDQIILVDNGSTDGSVEMVRQEFAQVELLVLHQNLGFSGGNNRGIGQNRCDYVALINNDVVLAPNWVEAMVVVLDSNPEIGSCACRLLFYHDRRMLNAAGDQFLTCGLPVNRGLNATDGPLYDEPARVFSACAAAALYRRTVFDQVGVFDEDLYLYGEDVDLGFRAQLAGFDCAYVPEAVAYHHHRKSSATTKEFSRRDYYIARNSLLIIVKNMPFALIRRYLLLILAGQLPLAVQAGMHGHLKGYARARIDALRLLPVILRARSQTYRRAQRTVEEIARLLTPGVPTS